MGIRRRTYIAISPLATPDLDASWISAWDAVVEKDDRGTLITFEDNMRPFWTRFSSSPGPAHLLDHQLEAELIEWLAGLGTDHFRFARCGDEVDVAGEWDMHAFSGHPEVRAIDQEVADAGQVTHA